MNRMSHGYGHSIDKGGLWLPGGGGLIAYLLRAIWSGAPDSGALADGQVLDTEAEGLFDGELTHSIGTVGGQTAISITSGRAIFGSDSIAIDLGATGLRRAVIVDSSEGRAVYFKADAPGLNAKFGTLLQLNTVFEMTAASRRVQFGFNTSNGILYSAYPTGGPLSFTGIGEWVASTSYEFILIFGTDSFYAFIKGGIYTTWTLLAIDSRTSVEDYYLRVLNIEESGPLDKILIPDTLYTEQITPYYYDEFDGAAGVFTTSRIPNEGTYQFVNNMSLDGSGGAIPTAAGVAQVVPTYLSGIGSCITSGIHMVGSVVSTLALYWVVNRNASDPGNDNMLVGFDTVSDLVKLVKREGGGDITLDSSSFTLVTATDYVIKINDDGVNVQVYIDDVLTLSGASQGWEPQVFYLCRKTDGSNYTMFKQAKLFKSSGYVFEGID